jgi:hypothetical protein
MFAGRTHNLPYIRNYEEARKWWDTHPKPPRSRKWDDYQRPLYNTASKHYRLESMEPDRYIDVILYNTTMARYHAPDADGNQRRLYFGHYTITSRNFMWDVLKVNPHCNTAHTTDGRKVVAPIYMHHFTHDGDTPFSADYLFTPDNKLIVERSAHTRHWRKVSTDDDKTKRARVRELFKPFLDIAMFRMQEYEANATLSINVGQPFGGTAYGYRHKEAVRNMTSALVANAEPSQDDINMFFDLGQEAFNTIASKRGYNQDGFVMDNWYNRQNKTTLGTPNDLERPVTADDLRKSLTDMVMKLINANDQSGWLEIPQFVVENEYPRTNVFARANP